MYGSDNTSLEEGDVSNLLSIRKSLEIVSSIWARKEGLESNQTPSSTYLNLFLGCTVVSEIVTVFVGCGAFDVGLNKIRSDFWDS